MNIMRAQHKCARVVGIILAALLLAFTAATRGQDEGAKNYSPQQIKAGSIIYAENCSTCHGRRLANPDDAPDLRKFPRNERARFLTTVSKGKESKGRKKMENFDDLITTEEIENVWAYVVAGEK